MLGKTTKLAFTTCPPTLDTAPTLAFWFVMFMFFGCGALLARPLGHNSDEPNMFMVFNYNGFGSLVVLCCAIWFVDSCHVLYLFILSMTSSSDGEREGLGRYFKLPRYRQDSTDGSEGGGEDEKGEKISAERGGARKRAI